LTILFSAAFSFIVLLLPANAIAWQHDALAFQPPSRGIFSSSTQAFKGVPAGAPCKMPRRADGHSFHFRHSLNQAPATSKRSAYSKPLANSSPILNQLDKRNSKGHKAKYGWNCGN
jgi:hypothetical protein